MTAVTTSRLLARIHLGLNSADPDIVAAAESCLSFLVLHLRESSVILPPALRPLYFALPDQ